MSAGIPGTLTKAQAADELHCSLRTIDRLLASGDLMAARAQHRGRGRKVLIFSESVRAYLQGQKLEYMQ